MSDCASQLGFPPCKQPLYARIVGTRLAATGQDVLKDSGTEMNEIEYLVCS